jgi:N,N'-diacetyllegionaminate synthase
LLTWFDRFRRGDRAELPCLVIGEVAQSHEGSLGMAHSFIDAIADAGAGAVKFQTHIAAAESTAREPWRVAFSEQDATRFDYWRRMEFSESQWRSLKAHAERRGLLFLSSPFSLEAIELLERIGVPAWKIASGETAGGPLFERMLASRLPVLLSSGMSTLAEIDSRAAELRAAATPFVVMQCTTAYPCPAERVGLNLIPEFAERYDTLSGLSDHSGTIYPALAAVSVGAKVIEVHVALSRLMFGPDVAASVTPTELHQITEGVAFIEQMRAHPVNKDTAAAGAAGLRGMFGKSIVASRELRAGTVLAAEHLAFKKPGDGLPPSEFTSVVGQRLRRALTFDEPLQRSDLEISQP